MRTILFVGATLVLLARTGPALGQVTQPPEPEVPEEPPPVDAPAPAPEPPAAEPPPAVETAAPTGYKKGFFIGSEDGRFALVINGRVQGRYTLESIDDTDRDTETAFSIARARLTLKGHAFEERIGYKFQTDFGKGDVVLKDFYVDYELAAAPVHVRAGQWKRPFSRQQINSSGNLELVDRAITDKAFNAGRDIGVAVHNNYEKSPDLEWAIGVFNGTGDKPVFSGDVVVDPMTGEGEVIGGGFSNVPDVFGPALVGRIGINRNGIKGYSEADLEGGPLRFAVAGSVIAEFDADDDDVSSVRGEVDGIVKVEGLSASGAVYVGTAQDGTGFLDQSYAALGGHVQAGYMITGKLQPAVRYAVVAPDGPDNNVHEILGGFSLYQYKHNFKWQTDVGAQLRETADGTAADLIARAQLQLAF